MGKNPCDKCKAFAILCSGGFEKDCEHAIIDFSHDNKADYCVLSTDCPHRKEKQLFQIIGLLNDLVSLSTIWHEGDVDHAIKQAVLKDGMKEKIEEAINNRIQYINLRPASETVSVIADDILKVFKNLDFLDDLESKLHRITEHLHRGK